MIKKNDVSQINETIEKYLKKVLNENEKLEIESKIKIDSLFYADVKLQKQIQSFVIYASLAEANNVFEKIKHHQKIVKSKKIQFEGPIRSLSFLSVFLMIVLIFQIIRIKSGNTISNEIIGKINQEAKSQVIINDSLKKTPKDSIEKQVPIIIEKKLNEDSIKKATEKELQKRKIEKAKAEEEARRALELNSTKTNDTVSNQIKTTNICDNVIIFAEVKTEASCLDKNTGKLSIYNVNSGNGSSPYTYSLDNGNVYSTQNNYENLKPGSYGIKIKDKNDCISQIGLYYIEGVQCSYNSQFSINSANFEGWIVPTKNKAGKVEIFNKKDKLVFTANFNVNEKLKWNGLESDGGIANAGNYSFKIIFSDGETTSGFFTITK